MRLSRLLAPLSLALAGGCAIIYGYGDHEAAEDVGPCTSASDCPDGEACVDASCEPCVTCGEALVRGMDELNFCPGSEDRLLSLRDCVCGNEHDCVSECDAAVACGGESPNEPCATCLEERGACQQPSGACLTDDGHGAPVE